MSAVATHTAVVDKFRHNYVSLVELQSQLLTDGPPSSRDEERSQQQSALKHFIACTSQGQQCLDRLGRQRSFTDDKRINGQPKAAAPPSSLFLRRLQQEVERLRRFVHSSAEDLWQRLLAAAEDLSQLRKTAARPQSQTQQHQCQLQHQELTMLCDGIGEDLVSVDSFVQHNATACAYLASLSDNLNTLQPSERSSLALQGSRSTLLTLDQLLNSSETKVPAVYKTCLSECILGTTDIAAVLIGLSDLYEQVRYIAKQLSADLSHGGAARTDRVDADWVAPDWFSRSTSKYWVQPQHRMRVKCEIIKNLPVSIYGGKRHKLAAGDNEDALKVLQQQQVKDSTLVSSVYLDDSDFHAYRSRLRREDGASVVRLRWYGPRSLKPDQKIYVEKKVHREPWTGEPGFKERCGVEQQYIGPYLEGRGGPPIMASNDRQGTFLKETQQWITQQEQAPVLRTLCNRAAFQESSTNEVRISLDSQLHMIKEGPATPKQPGDWCRDLGGLLGPGDVTHFQYDVAEIKLSVQETPEWLTNLTETGLLLRVPKFSKYLHGVTSLYPNRIDSTPYWFLPADKEGYVMTPATWEELADPKDPYLKEAASWLFPSTEASRADPQRKSKQFVQRFNQALRRNKRTTSSSGIIKQFSQRQMSPEESVVKITQDQGRVVSKGRSGQDWPGQGRTGQGQGRTWPGEMQGLQAPKPAGTDIAPRAGQVVITPQPVLGRPQQGSSPTVKGLSAGSGPLTGNNPAGKPSQTFKLSGSPQQPHAAPLCTPATAVPARSFVQQSPPSQDGRSSRPFLPSASPAPPAQWQQQDQPRGNSRDYMVDMQMLSAVPTSNSQASPESQHAQHGQGEVGTPSGTLAQQVPFYESSPEYMPTTLAVKTPVSSRVSAYFTGILRTHKQHADLETGRQSTGNPPDSAEDPRGTPQPGNSPKSVLFKSGIFQSPDQDKLMMSPEQAKRRARGVARTRVEPKVFFANERTFLQWLQISVLLMFTGLSLVGGSSVGSLGGSGTSASACAADNTACKASQYAGVIISPIAILFMVYALFMYKRRTIQILRRANVRYDDQSGPVLLVVLLIAATMVSLVLTAYGTLG